MRRAAWNAGTQPKRMPASIVAAIVKSSTGMLSVTSASEGNVYCGMSARIIFKSAHARPTPSVPPIVARARLSVRNCPKSCLRVAPRAARTAISF